MNTLGIDIGGTKIFVGRYNQNLELEAETKVPTCADKTAKHTLANLLRAIEDVKDSETESAGIAWAGFVDREHGSIVKAPNVPSLDGFGLCHFLTEHTGLPSVIENDARAFAYGARAELAPQSQMCLGLIVGTGVGSGIVANGNIIYGAHGYAGEVGHQVLQQKRVEAWLAGPGLKAALGVPPETRFSDLLPQRKEALLPQLEESLSVFAQWLRNTVLTFDPDHIIIGGGTARYFWQHYQAEILARTKAQLQGYPNDFKLEFYKGDNAGALGAAALSRVS